MENYDPMNLINYENEKVPHLECFFFSAWKSKINFLVFLVVSFNEKILLCYTCSKNCLLVS